MCALGRCRMRQPQWPLVRSVGVLCLVVAVPFAALTALGDLLSVDTNGRVGVTVDAAGRVVVLAEVCDGSVTQVLVAGPDRGSQRNEVKADLQPVEPVRASFAVDPARPGPAWSGAALALPLVQELHMVVAAAPGDDQQLSQATFVPMDLAQLRPGTVQVDGPGVGTQRRVPEAQFRAEACPS